MTALCARSIQNYIKNFHLLYWIHVKKFNNKEVNTYIITAGCSIFWFALIVIHLTLMLTPIFILVRLTQQGASMDWVRSHLPPIMGIETQVLVSQVGHRVWQRIGTSMKFGNRGCYAILCIPPFSTNKQTRFCISGEENHPKIIGNEMKWVSSLFPMVWDTWCFIALQKSLSTYTLHFRLEGTFSVNLFLGRQC